MKRKTKRIVLHFVFALLILVTVIGSIWSVYEDLQNDVENNVDIFFGFGAGIIIMLTGFTVALEIAAWRMATYFILSPNRKTSRNIINLILGVLMVIQVFFLTGPKLFEDDIILANIIYLNFFVMLILELIDAAIVLAGTNKSEKNEINIEKPKMNFENI